MAESPKRRKQPIKMTNGPVQPESALYRILQQIAQEIAKSLHESRRTGGRLGRQSEGSEYDDFPRKIGR